VADLVRAIDYRRRNGESSAGHDQRRAGGPLRIVSARDGAPDRSSGSSGGCARSKKQHTGAEHATCEADLRWLVFELRRTRQALLTILTRCQDEDAASALTDEIKFVANSALELYEPR
jgi:hypothetical protein